jgi:hypothetical protein
VSLLGQRCHQFAAEVGDVGGHAAPDQVGSGQEASESSLEGLSEYGVKGALYPAGVRGGVAYETREVARTLVS